jgi:uncharacterized membrane protein
MLKNKSVALYAIGGLFLLDVISIMHLLQSPIAIIYALVILLVLPGFLIFRILQIHTSSYFEDMIYSVSISVCAVIFLGLLLNTLFIVLHIARPLDRTPILWALNIFMLLLSVVLFFRDDTTKKHEKYKLSNYDRIISILTICLPLIAILGAKSMNASGNNTLTIVMLIFASLVALFPIIFKNKIHKNTFILVLLAIAMSVLLMYSLRSQYISGADISVEYKAFQITKNQAEWLMDNFHHAYNSCLSVTILPTIISKVTNINDQMIYKLIYSILFSLVPVIIYFIARKYLNHIPAYLAGLLFIVQPWFIDPMVQVARQEIAFLFFSILLLTIFSIDMNSGTRNFLIIIFGASMIVSHYTTTYVAIGLIVSTLIITTITKTNIGNKMVSKFKFKINKSQKRYIGVAIALILVILSLIWYTGVTQISSNLKYYISSSTSQIKHLFDTDMKSSVVNQVLFLGNSKNINIPNLQTYYINTSKTLVSEHGIVTEPNVSQSFKIGYNSNVPMKQPLPKIVPAVSFLYNIILRIVQLLFLVGLIVVIFSQKHKIDLELFIMFIVAIIFMALIIILPYASIGYNFDRLYMQLLMIICMVNVIGGIWLLQKIFSSHTSQIIYAIILCLLFLFQTGVVWQFSGGHPPTMWLNNEGIGYDTGYTHRSEVVSSTWLGKEYKNQKIFANYPARNKLWSFSGIPEYLIIGETFPAAIDRNGYVYLSYTNVVKQRSFFEYNGRVIGYNTPTLFLEQNKNRIYTNEETGVYK